VQTGITNALASLTLMSNIQADALPVLPTPLAADCAIVDLYAFGETAAVAEERRGGIVIPPAHEAHYISFESAKILAVRTMMTGAGGFGFSGAAVTELTS